MESSIAVFLKWRSARELLPTNLLSCYLQPARERADRNNMVERGVEPQDLSSHKRARRRCATRPSSADARNRDSSSRQPPINKPQVHHTFSAFWL